MLLPRKLPYLLKIAGWKTTFWFLSFLCDLLVFEGGNHKITSDAIYV